MLIKKKNELLQIFEKTQNELKNTSLLFKNTNEESNTRISRLETELSALNDKYNQEKKKKHQIVIINYKQKWMN